MKFTNPFRHPTPASLRARALEKAQADLHEARMLAEAWNSMLALQTTRVTRLQAEIADAALEFPVLDKATQTPSTGPTQIRKLFGGKTL